MSTTHSPGELFGPYTVYERLGMGGMATVHLAIHRESGAEVALKRLLPQFERDRELIEQFALESEIATALVHKNIVEVFDHGQVDGIWYLAMERIEGCSLLDLLRLANEERQPAPIGVSLHLLREILNALDYAMMGKNSYGQPFHIVHRDLSPSNIVVTCEGRLKIIDFGVARGLAGRYATNSGHVKGKLGYMSPEVLGGRPFDGRSDLFSAGVVTWELLTAKRLYRGSDSEQLNLRAQNHERTPPSKHNHWVGKELDRLLAVALSEDPTKRWSSAKAMIDALAPHLRQYGSNASEDAVLAWQQRLHAIPQTAEGLRATVKVEDTKRNSSFPLCSSSIVTAVVKMPQAKKSFKDDIVTIHDQRNPCIESGPEQVYVSKGNSGFVVDEQTLEDEFPESGGVLEEG